MRCFLRLSAVAGLLVASACGASSPESPTSPVPAVNPLTEGATWTIFANIDSCAGTPSECLVAAPVTMIELTLRTATSGNAISGVVTARAAWITDVPLLVAGQLHSDGSARLTGSYDSGVVSGSFRIIETELSLRPDERAGLSGSVKLTERRPSWNRTINASVLSAARQPFAAGAPAFQGAFDGFGTLRACTGACPFRTIGQRVAVSLRLTQAGNTVTGEYGTTRVSGTVSGNTVTISGEWRGTLGLDGLGTTLSRIESFSATVDALGRLTGTLRLYNEGMYDTGPGAITVRTPFTERLEIELTTVVRQ